MGLHNPRLNATASQLEFASARTARLEKIASRALTPIAVNEVKPDPLTEWIKRQEEINPIKPWFSVEEDMGPVATVKPKICDIQKVVSRYYEITHAEMIGQCRTAHLVRARHVAMYLCKRLTPHSLPEIGRRFGGRDHTTALSAYRRIDRLLETEELLLTQVTHLAKVLGGAIL